MLRSKRKKKFFHITFRVKKSLIFWFFNLIKILKINNKFIKSNICNKFKPFAYVVFRSWTTPAFLSYALEMNTINMVPPDLNHQNDNLACLYWIWPHVPKWHLAQVFYFLVKGNPSHNPDERNRKYNTESWLLTFSFSACSCFFHDRIEYWLKVWILVSGISCD